VSNRRDYARRLLSSILAKLAPDPGELRLTREERRYLMEICTKGLDGHADPLGTGKGAGGQSRGVEGLIEAQLVHRRIAELGSLRAACESVGVERSRDGSKSGAVEKNYKQHREALEASDRFYAAVNSGQRPNPADLDAILKSKSPGK
jgi:hypothetical protein